MINVPPPILTMDNVLLAIVDMILSMAFASILLQIQLLLSLLAVLLGTGKTKSVLPAPKVTISLTPAPAPLYRINVLLTMPPPVHALAASKDINLTMASVFSQVTIMALLIWVALHGTGTIRDALLALRTMSSMLTEFVFLFLTNVLPSILTEDVSLVSKDILFKTVLASTLLLIMALLILDVPLGTGTTRDA